MKPIDASEPQATGRLRPPGLSLLLAEVRGILEFNASLMLSPLLMGAPRGDGWLMKKVKQQLDPRGVFNPGRFVC